MNEVRYAMTQFCDDVRHEVGNKYSLMGCYGRDLFAERLPMVFPKLCAHVRVHTPIEQPFEQLVVRAMRNDDLMVELKTTAVELRKFQDRSVSPPEATRFELVVMLVMSFLEVSEPGKINIEVETESGVMKGGYLNIKEAPKQHGGLG